MSREAHRVNQRRENDGLRTLSSSSRCRDRNKRQHLSMRAGEFIRRIEALGARGVPVRFDKTRGKGSHGTLYYGERFTVVKDRRKECGPGLIAKMLADPGLTRSDSGRSTWNGASSIRPKSSGRGRLPRDLPGLPEAATDCRQHQKICIEATDCLEEAVAGGSSAATTCQHHPAPSREC